MKPEQILGSLRPDNPGSPPAKLFIWFASSSSTRRDASFTAARNKILQHFLVFAGKHLGFDLHIQHLFLTIHLSR